MKNIYNYVRVALSMVTITLFLASCSAEDFTSPYEAGIPLAAEYADAVQIEVNQETNTATFSFDRNDVIPSWTVYTKPNITYTTKSNFELVFTKAGEYRVDFRVLNANGQSDGVITKTVVINRSLISGFGGFDYNYEFNIWKNGTISKPTFWYAPGWSQIADPVYTLKDGTYFVSLPQATTDQWQSQMALGANFGSSADKKYDFSVILTSTKDHPGITVKLVSSTDDNVFYIAERKNLKANEPLCFWNSDMEGLDIANLKLVLDFGGNAAGTDIMIENIVFKDHANDDGTVVPEKEKPEPGWVAVDSPDNLWHGVNFTPWFYYAPGWSQLPDPAFTIAGTKYTVVFPSATAGQWQSQVHLNADNLVVQSSESYDFRVTLNASNEVNQVTLKLPQEGDDGTFLFEQRVDLPAGEDVIVKIIDKGDVNISKGKLVFDFGGNPDNTTVLIKDVILQKHKN